MRIHSIVPMLASLVMLGTVACGGSSMEAKGPEKDPWSGYKGTYATQAEPRAKAEAPKTEVAHADAPKAERAEVEEETTEEAPPPAAPTPAATPSKKAKAAKAPAKSAAPAKAAAPKKKK
jgi:hypothetical protein